MLYMYMYLYVKVYSEKIHIVLGHSNKIHCFTGNPTHIIGSACIFFINYCHHVIAIETTCASRTSLIATLSFEATSKVKQNGQQYHRPWQN